MDDQYKIIIARVEQALDTTGLQLSAEDKSRIVNSLVTQLFQRLLVVVVEKINPTALESFQKDTQSLFEKKDFEHLAQLMNKYIPDFSMLIKNEANIFLNEYINNVATEAKK